MEHCVILSQVLVKISHASFRLFWFIIFLLRRMFGFPYSRMHGICRRKIEVWQVQYHLKIDFSFIDPNPFWILGSIRSRIEKEIKSQSFYFHFIAWALPFILTVSIMVLSEVDGNSITGICFVGYENRAIRSGLFLVPVAILTFGFSVFFSFKGVFNLNRIKRSTTSAKEMKTLSSHILGMGIRTMLIVFFIFAFFIFENYEARNSKIWAKSLDDFIV